MPIVSTVLCTRDCPIETDACRELCRDDNLQAHSLTALEPFVTYVTYKTVKGKILTKTYIPLGSLFPLGIHCSFNVLVVVGLGMQLGSRVPAKCLSFFSSCSEKSNFRETQLLAHSSFHCHRSSRVKLAVDFEAVEKWTATHISLSSLYVYSTESQRMTPPTVGRSSQLDKCNQIVSHGCAQRPISSLESVNMTPAKHARP